MNKINRRSFIANVAVGGASMALVGGCQQQPAPHPLPVPHQPPNVVLLLLDTVRADKLGCYGYPHPTTPALDAVAAKGVVFERVISQCSWTRPSVGSVLTSRYPRSLGLYHEKEEILNNRFPTLPKILKKQGYTSLGITANPNLNAYFNFHEGFDHYIDCNVRFGWMDPTVAKNKRSNAALLPSAPTMFNKVLQHVSQANQTRPWYLQITAMEAHEWYLKKRTMIRPEYRELFKDCGEKYPAYLQSIRQLTDDVGQFINTLIKMPGWENTLFVIYSDHGESLDDHGGAWDKCHGRLLYESQVVVPWILYHPQWNQAHRRIEQPVRLLELMPTLLDYLNIPLPPNLDGSSLMPLLDGTSTHVELPEAFITETDFRNTNKIAGYGNAWNYFEHRKSHKGLAPKELQRAGATEQGEQSNRLQNESAIGQRMQAYVNQWEQQYPKVRPTPPERALKKQEIEQLKAIGYLGE